MDNDLKTRLCEDLAFSLHAMAQPLTVLRGSLGALSLRGASDGDANRYVELSNHQVERLCSLMSGMRILLDNFQSDAVCAPTNLGELISAAVNAADSNLLRFGPRVSIAEIDGGVEVLADTARAEDAIGAVLATVAGASTHGDEVHVTVELRDGFAGVMVCAAHANEKKLTSIDRLRLMVAEGSVRSQQGIFEYSEDPLYVSLKFPLHDREEPGSACHAFTMSERAR